jgi:hypothetical protein
MRHTTAHDLKPGPYRLPILLAVLACAMTVPAQSALAQCISPLRDGGFEQQQSRTVRLPWKAEGRAGIDVRRGFSRAGTNNAWARRSFGWNAIRQRVTLSAGTDYTLSGWVRTSANVRDGYFGFRRTIKGRPVAETRYAFVPGYQLLRVTFRPTQGGWYYVFAGFWAPDQDAWIQIDDLSLDSRCNDTGLNPSSG